MKSYFSVPEKEEESYNSKLFWVKPKMIARYHLLGHPYMFHVEAKSRCVCISVPGNRVPKGTHARVRGFNSLLAGV